MFRSPPPCGTNQGHPQQGRGGNQHDMNFRPGSPQYHSSPRARGRFNSPRHQFPNNNSPIQFQPQMSPGSFQFIPQQSHNHMRSPRGPMPQSPYDHQNRSFGTFSDGGRGGHSPFNRSHGQVIKFI